VTHRMPRHERRFEMPGMSEVKETKEHLRMAGRSGSLPPWMLWGPYVSERAWGTVREDYSPDQDAWNYLTHEAARSTAYQWGEDGLAAISDRFQLLIFALALWNGRDPILKERAFGLTPSEGNHGEDVKEYYFYLDNTPTHSYMKYLYKYPQSEYPYGQLIEENRGRAGRGLEYELLDTGIFDQDRYFDVFVEYAKESPTDVCIKLEAFNRGPDPAPLHIIPQLWFRNTWAHAAEPAVEALRTPVIRSGGAADGFTYLVAEDPQARLLRHIQFEYKLGTYYLYGQGEPESLFTDNETRPRPSAKGHNPTPGLFKDGFHRAIINGENSVNPEGRGTKACFHYSFLVQPGSSAVVRLRLTTEQLSNPILDVEEILALRREEANEFYRSVQPPRATDDERLVQRQALAGLLWSKQVYLFDVDHWLQGHRARGMSREAVSHLRNARWRHLNSMRIILMPDKWEYPWFAAWDLAFQCVALALVDADFAKDQLWLMLFEQFQHPNGQIPAYEWEFSDLNPPVHAWACWRVYNMDRIRSGRADRTWLERCFHKLLLNFTWWINKVDSQGNNIFEGGFLGLDNITVIDRSERLPGGVVLEQSDATGWMGMFCLNMMRIALELAKEDSVYESMATKFFEHYVYVGAAMKRMGGRDYSLWDEKDGFFYDVLRYPDGSYHKFRVRSLVGLIPLYAVERLETDWIKPFAEFRANLDWFVNNRQDLVQRCCHLIRHDGMEVYVLSVVDQDQMARILEKVYDAREFLSDFGIRSLSKFHEQTPFVFGGNSVGYEPAESNSKIKGGNSNWRGPIWFPTSFLILESLRKLGKAYGSEFRISLSGDSGEGVTLSALASDLADRLISIFTRDSSERRPVYGGARKFQEDPYWRDYVLFYEYFHGDNGAGIGAGHQGWTALVASLIDEWRR
jgi:hypothetical protein